jgi:thiol-disulfide isomerase/thioredoxin
VRAAVWVRFQSTLCLAMVAVLPACAAGEPAEPELVDATAATVLEAVREPGAKAVLVNVWATWCLPCREEFPDLMQLRHEYADRGLRLVLVSGDLDVDRQAAGRFLADQGVDFPTYFKQQDDMEFIDGLDPRWSGALPATFLYDSAGSLHDFWEGKASYETLEEKLLAVLGGISTATPMEDPR